MVKRYEPPTSIPRVKKKAFEAEIRKLAQDKRVLLEDSTKWVVRAEHSQWAEFLRESAPLHCMYEKLRNVSVEKVLKSLEALVNEVPAVVSSMFGTNLAVLFQRSDMLCLISREGVSLYSSDAELMERIASANVIPKVSVAKSVSMLSAGNRGIGINCAGTIDRPLNELAYSPEVQRQIHQVAEWAENPDPFGRIVIFAGPPGTGKSFAVRALITVTESVEWVIVPPNLVPRLSSPDMVQVLTDERSEDGPLGLIIEDADSLLRERVTGNDENVVSQLLNLGEGITGDLADLRIVMTTNVARLQIDKALLRKGRLFKFVQFDKMDPERATTLFKYLAGKDHEFRDPIALSDVYALANEHETDFKEPSGDGFGQYV